MIISRTPFRVSFFGGGTDYNGWFQEPAVTAVLASAVDGRLSDEDAAPVRVPALFV